MGKENAHNLESSEGKVSKLQDQIFETMLISTQYSCRVEVVAEKRVEDVKEKRVKAEAEVKRPKKRKSMAEKWDDFDR